MQLLLISLRYDFEFSVKAIERKRRREIIDNRKVPKSFQSCFIKNSYNKSNLVQFVFQKWKEMLPNALTSSETIYLVNLDRATDGLIS